MTWLKQARVNRRYWLVWADGVGYVVTSDLVLDCVEGNDR